MFVANASGRGVLTVQNIVGSHEALSLYTTITGADTLATFKDNTSTQVGSISVTASSTSFNQISDKRLKENIQPVKNSGELIDAMQPVTYDWADIPSHPTGVGMLAQDLYRVFPDAVTVGDNDNTLHKRSTSGFRQAH